MHPRNPKGNNMESLERAPSINPDLAEHSHGRVGRRTIYVGGAYCPQSEPRAAEPPAPRRPIEQPSTYTRSDDVPADPKTGLEGFIAEWPAPLRPVLVVAVLILGAVAMVTAGASVGIILTDGTLLP
jgi:hypothetical protein